MIIPNFTSEFLSQIKKNLVLLQSQNIDIYEKLECIYNEAERVNDFLRPYFSCHAGCSFCCKYDVSITAFEAKYISLKIHSPLKNEELSIKNNTYCQFLSNEICSIYKYRPLICRTYHVDGDPKNCEIDYFTNSQKIIEQYGTKIGDYGNQIYNEFARFINNINDYVFKKEIKDIRNYF